MFPCMTSSRLPSTQFRGTGIHGPGICYTTIVFYCYLKAQQLCSILNITSLQGESSTIRKTVRH